MSDVTRTEILNLVEKYYNEKFKYKNSWSEGERINYSGRYFDEEELINLVDSSLDFWLTSGRYVEEFEKLLCEFLGVSYCLTTTSGSSANLLAFMSLTSSKLGNRSIKKGDEVITVAAGFPTRLRSLCEAGLRPYRAYSTDRGQPCQNSSHGTHERLPGGRKTFPPRT